VKQYGDLPPPKDVAVILVSTTFFAAFLTGMIYSYFGDFPQAKIASAVVYPIHAGP